MLNHSCDPNTEFYPEADMMVFKTTKLIKRGEEITDSYINDLSMDRDFRQTYLLDHYGFVCQCIRCKKYC